jgi:hypothetical protein
VRVPGPVCAVIAARCAMAARSVRAASLRSGYFLSRWSVMGPLAGRRGVGV